MRATKSFVGICVLCVLSACSSMHQVRTADSHLVTLPKCRAAIEYQGSKWSFKGPKYQGMEAGEMEWQRTFRDAEPLIKVIDQQHLRSCESLNTMVSVSTLEEVKKMLAALDAVQQKMDQLELIIVSKDSASLQKFIEVYFLRVDPSFYEEHAAASSPNVVVARTSQSQESFKLRNIDARPTSSIVGVTKIDL
jgi:hypothetical protein